MRAFKEIKQHEFRLINMYRPETLTENFNQFLQEIAEKERTSAVKVDQARM